MRKSPLEMSFDERKLVLIQALFLETADKDYLTARWVHIALVLTSTTFPRLFPLGALGVRIGAPCSTTFSIGYSRHSCNGVRLGETLDE